MSLLPGHGVASNYLHLRRALRHGRTKRKTSDCGCDARVFVRRPGESSDSGLPVDGVAGKRGGRIVLTRVSPVQFRHLLGHCFGAYATPGGKLALLLRLRRLSVTVSICDGPSVNAVLRPWSRAHSHGFAQV